MTFDIEIVLRERDYAVTRHIHHAGHDAPDWTDADVESVLREILLAIDRLKNPDTDERYVALRGLSWIVEPAEGGVVIAIEIPSGAAVAGPFRIPQAKLDAMIVRVLSTARLKPPAVH